MLLIMMVKSTSQSSPGQFNKRKRKVWIKLNNDDSDQIEYEVTIVDFSCLNIILYDQKGRLLFLKKEKNKINFLV
jgi:hypothetical protein